MALAGNVAWPYQARAEAVDYFHYSDVMWALWYVISLATKFFVQQLFQADIFALQLFQADVKGNIKATHYWAPIQYKDDILLVSIGNPIVEIRRSYDRLISTMGFPIPVRRHLYIESGPWSFVQGNTNDEWILSVLPNHPSACPRRVKSCFGPGRVKNFVIK